MNFQTSLLAVAVMLLYALPGWLLVKTKIVKGDAIHNFSKVLLYVSQPCLTVYSFSRVTFSWEMTGKLALCFLFAVVIQAGLVLLLFFVFKKKRNEIVWRVICVAAVFSNCGFFGVPLLERLLPGNPEVIAYSSVFSLAMNMIGWSLGLYIVSLDKRYIRAKKIFVNPATIGFAVALVLYFTGFKLPAEFSGISDAVTLVGKMSTPLCMLILGMRLATVPIKEVFGDWRQYLAAALNQIAYPLLVFALLYFLPVDPLLKTTFVILCACPVASNVLNYAEILGQGQDKAANMVLLGTLFSILTVPLVCLIL